MRSMSSKELKDFQSGLEMSNQEFADFLGVSKRIIEEWRGGGRNISGLTAFALKSLRSLHRQGFDVTEIMQRFNDSGKVELSDVIK